MAYTRAAEELVRLAWSAILPDSSCFFFSSSDHPGTMEGYTQAIDRLAVAGA